MSGSPIESILDSAQRAASSGDYALAESLLREVARLQAETLGPQHPALANTFNNLGVVCERAHNLLDAGKFYRQAFSIASACLDAEDPLVITSRNNFNEFHRALGLVDTTAFPPVDVAAPVGQHDRLETTAERADDPNISMTAPTFSSKRLAVVAGIAIAVALASALASLWPRAPIELQAVEQRALELGYPLEKVSPTPSQESAPSQPSATGRIAQRPASVTVTRPPAASTEPAVSKTTVPTSTHGDARVIEVSLCESLSTTGGRWECTPASDPEASGLLYFYTRIVSPTSSRIHHRWYQNGVLRQDVSLDLQANPSAGYRTYSRHRVDPGDWRVAVVDADGAVLREERVAVR
jgi:Protein of unknown function (DUF2914)/Tetratricopeptide repeat